MRGKLITLGLPKMALVVRGRVDLGTGSREGKEGWSAVIGRPSLKPLVQHSEDLGALLALLFHEEKSAAGV